MSMTPLSSGIPNTKKTHVLPSPQTQAKPASPTSNDQFERKVRFAGSSTSASHASNNSRHKGSGLSRQSKPLTFISEYPLSQTSANKNNVPSASGTNLSLSMKDRDELLKQCFRYVAAKTACPQETEATINEFASTLNEDRKKKGLQEINPDSLSAILFDAYRRSPDLVNERNSQIVWAYREYVDQRKTNPNLGEVKRYKLLDRWNQNCKNLALKEVEKGYFYKLLLDDNYKNQATEPNAMFNDTSVTASRNNDEAGYADANEEATMSINMSGITAALQNVLSRSSEKAPASGSESHSNSADHSMMSSVALSNRSFAEPDSILQPFNINDDMFARVASSSTQHQNQDSSVSGILAHNDPELIDWATRLAEAKYIENLPEVRKAEEELDQYVLQNYPNNPDFRKFQIIDKANELIFHKHQQAQALQYNASNEEMMPFPMEDEFVMDFPQIPSEMPSSSATNFDQQAQPLPTSLSESRMSVQEAPDSAVSGNSISNSIIISADSPAINTSFSRAVMSQRGEKRPRGGMISQAESCNKPSESKKPVKPSDLADLNDFAKTNDRHERFFMQKLLRTLVNKLGFKDKVPAELNELDLDNESIFSHLDEDDVEEVKRLMKLPEGATHSTRKHFDSLQKKLPNIILSNKKSRDESQ